MGKNTQFNHFTETKREFECLWWKTIYNKESFQNYLDERSKIYETNSYKRLTRNNREYISGFDAGMFFLVGRFFVEWRLFDKEGNLVLTGHSAQGLNYKFDYSACREREKKGLPIGHHTWKDSDGKKIWS